MQSSSSRAEIAEIIVVSISYIYNLKIIDKSTWQPLPIYTWVHDSCLYQNWVVKDLYLHSNGRHERNIPILDGPSDERGARRLLWTDRSLSETLKPGLVSSCLWKLRNFIQQRTAKSVFGFWQFLRFLTPITFLTGLFIEEFSVFEIAVRPIPLPIGWAIPTFLFDIHSNEFNFDLEKWDGFLLYKSCCW